jgi:hypothetical protein
LALIRELGGNHENQNHGRDDEPAALNALEIMLEAVVRQNEICLKRIDFPTEHTGYSFACSGSCFQSFVFWFSLRALKNWLWRIWPSGSNWP